MNPQRLHRIQEETLNYGLDGLALVPGPSMAYVSGIQAHLSERPIVLFLPADDEPAVIIPALEAMKAEAAGIAPDRIFDYTDQEWYPGAFQRACAYLELSDFLLGVEALSMRVVEIEMLKRYAPGLQTAHADPVLAAVRGVKDDAEITALQEAVRIAETALQQLLPAIRIGQTERHIAGRLTQALLEAGSDGLPFRPIVSAGPNAASPHAVPTDRPLQSGDLLVVDWGAYFGGYVSDITRTFAVGDVDAEARRIHETVQAANAAGRMACAPGASGESVDQAARAVIDAAGYGDFFLHRTGHGLGMEAHEPPSIVEGNTGPLLPGNVFTVEPGIYLPGKNGVRIEDDVVIVPGGHMSLTAMARELRQIG